MSDLTTPVDVRPRERFVLGDPLRGVAAVSVMANHLVNISQLHTGLTLRESFGPIAGRTFGNFYVGLYIFFALSGYLIGRPFVTTWLAGESGPRLRAYLARRLLRIVPAFWLFLTLAVVVLGVGVDSTRQGVAVYAFMQDFDPSPLSRDFGQAWSMHSEIVFYLLLPAAFAAAGLVVRRHRLAWLSAALAVAWAASLLAIVADPDVSMWGRFPTTLFAFVPGLLLAAAAPWMTARLRLATPATLSRLPKLVLGVGAVLLVLYAAMPIGQPAPRAAVISFAVLALLATALGREWAGLRPWRALDNRLWHWLGERSYGIYVIHYAVIFEVADHIDARGPIARLLIVSAIAVPITIALAALSWRFFEHPILRWRRRFHRGEPERVTVTAGA